MFEDSGCMVKTESNSIFFLEQQVYWHPPEVPLFNCMIKDALEMYTCQKCGFQVYMKVNLEVHLAFFHNNELDVSLEDFCSFSEEKFNLTNILKCYKCEICSFQTHSLLVSLKHGLTHPKIIKVNPSNRKRATTPSKKTINRAINTTITRKVAPKIFNWFECEQCSFKCKSKYSAMTHIQRKHMAFNESDLLECDKCSFKTPFKASLRIHSRQHIPLEERKSFPCDFCPHKAKQKKHLEIHVLAKHTPNENIKWFYCEQCTYKAKCKSTLSGHMVAKHTAPEDINWVRCDKCLYRCKRKSHLKQHSFRKHKVIPK